MRVPEIAYRFLYPKDVAGPTFELSPEHQVSAGTTAARTVTFNGPAKDRVFVLTNIAVDLAPGATQAVVRFAITADTPGGLAFNIAMGAFAGTADKRETFNWQGEVYVGGSGTDSTIITAVGTFSAGVASNSMAVSIFGTVIPRGNIAPF